MNTSTTPGTDPPVAEPNTSAASRKRGPQRAHGFFHHLRRRLRKFVQVSHRWVALIAGLALLVVVVSGTLLLWKPEIQRTIAPSNYKSTGPVTVDAFVKAPAAAEAAVKDFVPNDLEAHHGIIAVAGTVGEKSRNVIVDPGSGKVNGVVDPNGGVFGFLDNLHECGLGCEEYPGYIAFLNKSAAFWGNDELTVGGLILGILGLVLLILSIGGLYLWWPGVQRFSRGFRIRRKSAYSINYDLHKVVGFVAIPFLLLWAITGTGFEFKQIEDAWFAALPGVVSPEADEFASRPPQSKSEQRERAIGLEQAAEAALAAVPGSTLSTISVPDTADEASAYSAWLTYNYDPWGHSNYPGDVGVDVDRFDATRTRVNFGDPAAKTSVAAEAWNWSYPAHAGLVLNGWWRSFWVFFSLVPILLAFTGIYTWLSRKRKVRAKKRRRKQPPAALAT